MPCYVAPRAAAPLPRSAPTGSARRGAPAGVRHGPDSPVVPVAAECSAWWWRRSTTCAPGGVIHSHAGRILLLTPTAERARRRETLRGVPELTADALQKLLVSANSRAPPDPGQWLHACPPAPADLDQDPRPAVPRPPPLVAVNASWLDQIEIVFSETLTPNDFDSTAHVRQRILAFFADRNRRARPIQWTYTAHKLLAKAGRQRKLAATGENPERIHDSWRSWASTVRPAAGRISPPPAARGPSGSSRSTTRAATTDGSTSASSVSGLPPDRDRAS